MAYGIGVLSQKGGAGKSTIARMLAREFATHDWRVLIADMDNKQITSTDWTAMRLDQGIDPEVSAQPVKDIARAISSGDYNLVIFDGKPSSGRETLEIAKIVHLVVIPTGASLDDLKPAVLLGHDFVKEGVPRERFAFALCRVGSEGEARDARNYIEQAGYKVFDGELYERVAYRMAQNRGRAVTETQFDSLNVRAVMLAQSIIDAFEERIDG